VPWPAPMSASRSWTGPSPLVPAAAVSSRYGDPAAGLISPVADAAVRQSRGPGRLHGCLFGHAEWAVFAPGLKTLEDASHLRSQILIASEMAELITDPAERAAYLTLVVIGAGPTGVEMAGQVAELAYETLPREYRRLRPTRRSCSSRRARRCPPRSPQAAALPAAAAVDGREHIGEHRGASHGPLQRHCQGPCRRPAYSGPHEGLGDRSAGLPLAAMLATATGADTDRAGRVAVHRVAACPVWGFRG
jgi:NADH:ubiquinone reductase (H+-translocating)